MAHKSPALFDRNLKERKNSRHVTKICFLVLKDERFDRNPKNSRKSFEMLALGDARESHRIGETFEDIIHEGVSLGCVVLEWLTEEEAVRDSRAPGTGTAPWLPSGPRPPEGRSGRSRPVRHCSAIRGGEVVFRNACRKPWGGENMKNGR